MRESINEKADPNIRNNSGISPTTIAKRLGHDKILSVAIKHGGLLNPMEQSYPSNDETKGRRQTDSLEVKRVNDEVPLLYTVRNVISSNDAYAGEIVNIEEKRDVNEDLYVKLDNAFPKRKVHSVNAAFLGASESLINKLNSNTMDAVDAEGCSALMKASYKGHRNIAMHLITIGAELNLVDNTGVSALEYACLNGHLGIVKQLIEAGVDKKGGNATTPLINASFSGHVDIVRYLIEKEVDINATITGKSAVMISCWMYHFNIASILVEAGAVVSQGSTEWIKRGVIFYRKIAFEQNVWAVPTDATGSPVKVKKSKTIEDVVEGITLKEKMNYLTAEENDTMSRIESFFSTGKECAELRSVPKLVVSQGNRISTGPRQSRGRRPSSNRQALNLDV